MYWRNEMISFGVQRFTDGAMMLNKLSASKLI